MLIHTAYPSEEIWQPLTSKWCLPDREDAVPLFPHLQVVQHSSAHGLCVLVLLIYSLFPGKSSVVCRSCSSDIVYFYLWPLKPCPYTHFMYLPLPALPQSKVELQHTPGNCTKNPLILFYCSASFLLLSHQVSLEPLQLPFSKLLSLLKSLLKNIFHF